MLSYFALAALAVKGTASLEITEVKQTSVFAGKLGQRVTEDVILKTADGTILVHIAGPYHTRCTHRNRRLKVGQHLLLGDLRGQREVTIRRDLLNISG